MLNYVKTETEDKKVYPPFWLCTKKSILIPLLKKQ